MQTMSKRSVGILLGALAMGGCSGALEPTGSGAEPQDPDQAALSAALYREQSARELASTLRGANATEELANVLRAHREGVALTELRGRLPALEGVLSELETRAERTLDRRHVAELWLYEPTEPAHDARPLVAYAPGGDESEWSRIIAYDEHGAALELDPREPPAVPVIVIETSGRLAMRRMIEVANLELGRASSETTGSLRQSLSTDGTWTLKLDRIRLADDQEPWISGKAEMYAIVSGIAGNQPSIQLVELPYLDHDGTTYAPNQVLLNWGELSYAAANVQLFEHDDSTSYQELVANLIQAIGALGQITGEAPLAIVADLGARIVRAMPSHWYSNDDDYVDSFYTIERDFTYADYPGVGTNATATFTPFFLRAN